MNQWNYIQYNLNILYRKYFNFKLKNWNWKHIGTLWTKYTKLYTYVFWIERLLSAVNARTLIGKSLTVCSQKYLFNPKYYDNHITYIILTINFNMASVRTCLYHSVEIISFSKTSINRQFENYWLSCRCFM